MTIPPWIAGFCKDLALDNFSHNAPLQRIPLVHDRHLASVLNIIKVIKYVRICKDYAILTRLFTGYWK